MTPPVLQMESWFQDRMMLPCDRAFSVWGRGRPGAGVQVRVGPHAVSGHVSGDGRWALDIPALPEGEVTPFTVESGPERMAFRDVLAGDLWLCSGQSNMAMTLQGTGFDDDPASRVGDQALRLFQVNRQFALAPGAPIVGVWKTTCPEPSADCPALAFHFGRLLRRQLGARPVGLLVSATGDTPLAAWMSRDALVAAGDTPAVEQLDRLFRDHPDAAQRIGTWHDEWRSRMAGYDQAVGAWMPLARQARAAGAPLPPRPERAKGRGDPQTPTILHHGMLAPLFRIPIRGIAWYQGETDAIRGTGAAYAGLFRAFIQDLRRRWTQPELPFLFVQLPRHNDIQSSLPPGQWAIVRDAQARARSLPRVAMVVGLDQGDSVEIHPKRKEELARRLAAAALAEVYGRAAPHPGPEFDHAERGGTRLALHFRHTGAGLRTTDGKLPRGVEVAGPDARFVDARTELGHGRIVAWNDTIPEPHAVRYAWADDPDANICNGAGWPLAPFRCHRGDTTFVENRHAEEDT